MLMLGDALIAVTVHSQVLLRLLAWELQGQRGGHVFIHSPTIAWPQNKLATETATPSYRLGIVSNEGYRALNTYLVALVVAGYGGSKAPIATSKSKSEDGKG